MEGQEPPHKVCGPYPLMHGRSRAGVLFGPTGGRVTSGHTADRHLRMALALRSLHAHELHVVVLVEAKRHLLCHAGGHAHLWVGRASLSRAVGASRWGTQCSWATIPQGAVVRAAHALHRQAQAGTLQIPADAPAAPLPDDPHLRQTQGQAGDRARDGARLRTVAVHLFLPVQVSGHPRGGLRGLRQTTRSNTKQA